MQNLTFAFVKTLKDVVCAHMFHWSVNGRREDTSTAGRRELGDARTARQINHMASRGP